MRNHKQTPSNVLILALAMGAPMPILAQQDEPTGTPDEVIVIGERRVLDLRIEMLQLEKTAYEVFNQFNDERRFDIHCRMHQPTGTRFETQVCEPEFEIEAKRTHAAHYFENMRDMLNQIAAGAPVPSERTPPNYVPPEALIASQQKAYRNKLKDVAEQHPEFLDALVKYTESKQRYERAAGLHRE